MKKCSLLTRSPGAACDADGLRKGGAYDTAGDGRDRLCGCGRAGDQTVQHTDEAWISEMVTALSGAEPTGRESVQDIPQAEDLVRLDLQLGSGASTLFAYQEDGHFYVEQPYQGIYQITGEQYAWLGEAE